MSRKIRETIRNLDPYFYLFILFIFLTIAFFFSPVIIYEPHVRNFISYFLKDLQDYRKTYLGIIGTTLGTGLAVSSAVWLQRTNLNKKEKEEKVAKAIKVKQAEMVLENWIKREISMLWGMWIWAKYDFSVFRYDEKVLPFEPYCIERTKVFECYLLVDYKLSKKSKDAFYELYYLAEKVNQYIENYNAMNYDILEISSHNGLGTGINIASGIRKNSSSERYKDILKSIVDDKRGFLFNDNSRVISEIDYYMKLQALNTQLLRIQSDFRQCYQNDHKELNLLPGFNIEDLLKNETEIPEQYKPFIVKVNKTKESMRELNLSFQGDKERYFQKIEEPSMSSTITELLNELKCISETAL